MTANSRTRHLLRRLGRMSWAEIEFRGRQQLRNRCDGLLYTLIRSTPGLDSQILPNAGPAGRFFFSAQDLPRLVNLVRSRLPGTASQIVAHAEGVCAHRVDLLGYTDVDLGAEIDWHLDPVHGKRAPRQLWYRIPYLDCQAVGDVKIIWELNRHQHWVTLGKAYRLAGDERYAREFARQHEDWQKQNPYPVGVNWASSLEVALRSLSWLWARELFAGASCLGPPFWQDMQSALGRNARFISRNLSTYFSPNTHLLGEAAALFFIGVLCPEIRGASRYRTLGWKILLEQAQRQVRRDGGHFEQSLCYHVYALDLLLHARILASRNQIAIPGELDRTLVAMLEFLSALGTGGPPPLIGDDDGGRLFDPRRNHQEHLLDPLSTGAVLFARADFKAVVKSLREETLWLLGLSAGEEFDRLPETQPQAGSRAFPETGLYVVASPGLRLILDAGPTGAGRGGHGHADALSVCLAIEGRESLGDPGTFTYAVSNPWRNQFRGTPAHNTLTVDGLDQAVPDGPFAWQQLAESRAECWLPGVTFDLLVASHDGYQHLPSPVRHRRLVFFVKGQFWLVVDTVEGKGEHQLEFNWHFPPQSAPSASSDGMAFCRGDLAVVPVRDARWTVRPVPCWWSPSYGARQPGTALRLATKATLPVEFATLLLPGRWADHSLGVLERLQAEKAGPRGYRYLAGSCEHSWVLAPADLVWRIGPFAGDAAVAYCAQGSDGAVHHAILCEGTFLARAGEKILETDRKCDRVEYLCRGGCGELFCSEAIRVGGALGSCPGGGSLVAAQQTKSGRV